jgi:multidrug resistance efflux pump
MNVMFRKYLLPLLAIAGVVFAVFSVVRGQRPVPPAPPVAEPARAPYQAYVAGAGIIEASTENIAIGTNVPGIVTDVVVKVGDRVKAGDALFKIDDRTMQSQLVVQQAALESARQKLAKLVAMPRAEDVPPAEAKVTEAEAALADAKDQLKLYESVNDKRAISEDELSRRRWAVEAAGARLASARAALQQVKAGAWKPDLEIARAEITSAEANIKATRIETERLAVKAPVTGRLLQVKIRPGEYAPGGVLATPLMLLGATDTLHVRVDIDENDAWRVRPEAAAVAYVRGNRDLNTKLTFVRIEPYVVPKKSLTGESTERVDTRVLQVLYSFPAESLPVYVGQQMDVFIEAPGLRDTVATTKTLTGSSE